MGRSSRQAVSYHCNLPEKGEQNLEKRTGRSWDENKQRCERCGQRREGEGGRKGEGERNETHFYSSCKCKLAMYIFDFLGYTYRSTKQ